MNQPGAIVQRRTLPVGKFKFALAVSRFNEPITRRLMEGAHQCLREYGVAHANIGVFHCPGAFELPQVAKKLALQKRWNAVVCLGAVIRGETQHFEYVAGEAARGIQQVALETGIPVIFGVLTTNNEQQAFDRAGGRQGHKGRDAALAAMEMAVLYHETLNKRRR